MLRASPANGNLMGAMFLSGIMGLKNISFLCPLTRMTIMVATSFTGDIKTPFYTQTPII
jgi:hypothetical protein